MKIYFIRNKKETNLLSDMSEFVENVNATKHAKTVGSNALKYAKDVATKHVKSVSTKTLKNVKQVADIAKELGINAANLVGPIVAKTITATPIIGLIFSTCAAVYEIALTENANQEKCKRVF